MFLPRVRRPLRMSPGRASAGGSSGWSSVRAPLPVVPRGVAKGYFRVRLRVATRDRPGAGVPVGSREPVYAIREEPRPGRATRPRFRRSAQARRVASVHRYVGSTSSIQIRHCSSPVKEANTPRWNVPLKNENYSTKLPSRQPLARQRSRYGSTADSNACLYDRPHRRHRLSIIRSPYRLPPRGSCHRSSA